MCAFYFNVQSDLFYHMNELAAIIFIWNEDFEYILSFSRNYYRTNLIYNTLLYIILIICQQNKFKYST